jgi:hypothetical protein
MSKPRSQGTKSSKDVNNGFTDHFWMVNSSNHLIVKKMGARTVRPVDLGRLQNVTFTSKGNPRGEDSEVTGNMMFTSKKGTFSVLQEHGAVASTAFGHGFEPGSGMAPFVAAHLAKVKLVKMAGTFKIFNPKFDLL